MAQTVSFHLSSNTAQNRGGGNFELPLSPGLSIPHAVKECTVYLHNMLFNNTIANVSGPLYQNNTLDLAMTGQTAINLTLEAGGFSLNDVERLIAEHLYADQAGMWTALTTAAQALGSHVELANPYTNQWEHTVDRESSINALSQLSTLSASNVYIKPVTLAADTVNNRVLAVVLGGLTVTGTLWQKLLGFGATQTGNNSNALMQAENVAKIDKTRAVAFHCPSLCVGTYSTGGQLGGSQLALIPITVGLGETQSFQVSVPIKLPCRAAGSTLSSLNFFLSNEDGDPVDLLADRFEAVVVVEWTL